MTVSKAAMLAVLATTTTEAERVGNPVRKVVKLLQDMQQELEAELEDDQKVHELLTCWCKTNDQEKNAAIQSGKAESANLESNIEAALAKLSEMKSKRKATQEEKYADQKALDEAEEQRMKDNKAFHAEETDLNEAIDASKYALEALSKHQGFAQVRSVTDRLRKARVAELAAVGGLPIGKREALRSFLFGENPAPSFLQIPGMQSYASQSGAIFGIIEQLAVDFKDSLADAQKAEQKSVENFEDLKVAKEQEIATAKQIMSQLDEDIATTMEKHQQYVKELADTEHQLELDSEFLADLTAKCETANEEFAQRSKDRRAEIAAVGDTIGIINSDEAFDASQKTDSYTFLQVASDSDSDDAVQRQYQRHQAASVLRQAALRAGGEPRLVLLAGQVQLADFTEVKQKIDLMMAELGNQNKEEIELRDWCIKELDTNTRDIAKYDDKNANLQAHLADLDKTLQTLSDDIASANNVIAETQASMKRASEMREGENAGFQQTVSDNRVMQMILKKALTRMQEVYGFLQSRQPGAPHIATSGTDRDAGNGPAAFKTYEENPAGGRIVKMLEEIIADAQKTEDEAIRDEEDAQTAYERLMQQNNDLITANQNTITNLSVSQAKAKDERLQAQSDHKATMDTLGDLDGEKHDLHKRCDYTLKNFDARQKARTTEIESLRDAKNILSGMQ